MRGVCALIACLALAGPAYAQVVPDAVSAVSLETGSTTNTFAHTVSGSDRGLLVACNAIPLVSVTYDSVSLSLGAAANGDVSVEHWTLVAPNTGTHNVVATFTISGDSACVALSYTGVDQGAPFGTAVSDLYSGSSGAHSHSTTSQTDGLVVDAFTLATAGGPLVTDGGQTDQSGPDDDLGLILTVSSKPGAASVTTGYTWTSSFARWAHVTVPINPAAAGGSSGGGSLGLSGVGR